MKVKNTTGENRIVGGHLVLDGAVLEVESGEVYSFTCQPHWGDPDRRNWEPADDEAKAEHEAAEAASQPDAEPSIEWTKKQLEAYAAEHDVDIVGAKTKADIFAAITEHTPEG